jgi:hypothetical protein
MRSVTHPSTNHAQRSLTTVMGREPTFPKWNGRWRIPQYLFHYDVRYMYTGYCLRLGRFQFQCYATLQCALTRENTPQPTGIDIKVDGDPIQTVWGNGDIRALSQAGSEQTNFNSAWSRTHVQREGLLSSLISLATCHYPASSTQNSLYIPLCNTV